MALPSFLTKDQGRNLFLPAHGRGLALPFEIRELLANRAGAWDLPEIPDFGGPLLPLGAVAESQKASAEAFGADRCWYGVNGATGLLQASLLAISSPGDAVLIPRNVHKSILHACLLGGLTPVLFDIPFLSDRGHYTNPDLSWMEGVIAAVFEKGLDISCAVLVNPTYHGYAIDLKPIVSYLHRKNLPVLVDEAHGAYFVSDVEEVLPKSALVANADLIVHSLHKSAQGLVQSAVLWAKGNLIDTRRIDRSLSWLQTTSPSSLLLASCEASLKEFKDPEGLKRLKERILDARILADGLRKDGVPLLDNQDPLRLILHTAREGINGFVADDWFIKNGVMAELPEPGCLTFCLGLAHHMGLRDLIRDLWHELVNCKGTGSPFETFSPPPIPKISIPEMEISSAWRAQRESIYLAKAEGRILSDLICPYPPGIPLAVPGEKLDRDRVDWMLNQSALWPSQVPNQINVVAGDNELTI